MIILFSFFFLSRDIPIDLRATTKLVTSIIVKKITLPSTFLLTKFFQILYNIYTRCSQENKIAFGYRLFYLIQHNFAKQN